MPGEAVRKRAQATRRPHEASVSSNRINGLLLIVPWTGDAQGGNT